MGKFDHMEVIGIDPGLTTGLCRFVDGKLVDRMQLNLLELGLYLQEHLEPSKLLVVESYKLRASSAKAMIGNSFPAPEAIGLIRFLAEQRDCKLVFQSPAQKEFYNDQRLKDLGFWYKGNQHYRDALRHVLYYVTFALKDKRFLL